MWLIPGLLVLVAILLAPLVVSLDERFGEEIAEYMPFVFGGGSDAARDILATIATAMASVVGIAFSIVIVVLQLAASQYSPRVITTFRRDRGQQVVMGMYLATFIYSLLVLRQVRASNDVEEAFIPSLAMLVALALSMVCLGLLVYFVHHVSQQLRVSDIAGRIHGDLDDITEELYPSQIAGPFDPEADDDELIREIEEGAGSCFRVLAPRSGYLQQIDGERLTSQLKAPAKAIHVEPMVGDYVFERGRLATVYFDNAELPEDHRDFEKRVRKCIIIGSEPTLSQNSQLAVQQLVDIALRALSTGVNDPSTARQALDQLCAWLAGIAHRRFPSQVRDVDGRQLVLRRPSFRQHVERIFGQIRDAARQEPAMLHSILNMMEKMLETRLPDSRLAPLKEQLLLLKAELETGSVENGMERAGLMVRVEELLVQVEE